MNTTGNDKLERAEKRREEERAEIKLNIPEATSAVNNSCMRVEKKIPNPSKDLVESDFNTCNCLRV